jgi:hypothetical protein
MAKVGFAWRTAQALIAFTLMTSETPIGAASEDPFPLPLPSRFLILGCAVLRIVMEWFSFARMTIIYLVFKRSMAQFGISTSQETTVFFVAAIRRLCLFKLSPTNVS